MSLDRINQLPDLAGKRVLVTGGSGFIGGRLVERLALQHDSDVRVLIRAYSRAARIARFPCELMVGDITDPRALESAVDQCDLVFHCACGTEGSRRYQRSVNVDGSLNVLKAAKEAGVHRVIHISTISVYGQTVEGDVDERTPRRYSRNAYADTKLDAEEAVLEWAAKNDLAVSILQPTMVYGPYGPAWTRRILDELKTGRVILVNGGDGLCHPIYVDDVVTLMLLAAGNDNAVGEVFVASGEHPVTWKDFYGRFEKMLGYESTVTMSLDESLAFSKKRPKRQMLIKEAVSIFRSNESVRNRIVETAEAAAIIRILQGMAPESTWQRLTKRIIHSDEPGHPPSDDTGRPIHMLPPRTLKWHATKPMFRIDKAKRLLGYRPEYSFGSGMSLTEDWARWAHLLNE